MAGIQRARSLATRGGALALKTSGVTSGNGVGAIVAIAQPQHRKPPRATAEPATARLSSAASACRPRHEPRGRESSARPTRRGPTTTGRTRCAVGPARLRRRASSMPAGTAAAQPGAPTARKHRPQRRRKALSVARRGLDGASLAATHLRSRAVDAGKPSAERMSAQAEIGAPATRSRPRCTCQP